MSLAALSARNWASQASASAALTGSIASSDATASTPPASLAGDSLSGSPITVLRVAPAASTPWPHEHSPPVGDICLGIAHGRHRTTWPRSARQCHGNACQQPSVDTDILAGDEARARAGQEADDLGDLRSAGHAAHRMHAAPVLDERLRAAVGAVA